MQNIESTIVELGGIFQQLAHMVKEQDEVVQRLFITLILKYNNTLHTVFIYCFSFILKYDL